MTHQTSSADETQKLAQNLAEKFKKGAILALEGNLGAGKTTFTQGFAKGLGISEKVISPTFILMRQYNLPFTKAGKFFHIDLYRLENLKAVESLGLSEIFANPNNIILIEWAEKLGNLLPKEATFIKFKTLDENKREIKII
ncbi:MAG: tRNA (adenosine(37)-N6)-threonylcarbamoyltransferase complex ATPase subunit type 1 TsaE [Candidatus Daviesbacteria bacterium]